MPERDPAKPLVFGTGRGDAFALAREIGELFQLPLEHRESLHQGGDYFLGELPSGESLRIYRNRNEHDRSYREPRHPEAVHVFYITGAAPENAAALAAKVGDRISGLKALKDRTPDTSINVIDVESTCWDGEPPAGQASDIIEIGITVVDFKSLEIRKTESILVRPAHGSVSEFCTKLTTLTPKLIEESGVPFAAALKKMRAEFNSRERLFVSYGDYDRKMFERQCAAYQTASPFGPRHLNVKNLLAVSLGLEQEIGMAEALDRLQIPLEGVHHRGGDDSRNIAKILVRLLKAARSNVG